MKAKSNIITFRATPALARQIKTASRQARQTVSTFLGTLVTSVLKGKQRDVRRDAEVARREPGEVVARNLHQPERAAH